MEEQASGWEDSGRGNNVSKRPWMGMWNALCVSGKQQMAQGGCVLYQCPVSSMISLCLQAGMGERHGLMTSADSNRNFLATKTFSL